jgi:hypothetical protein
MPRLLPSKSFLPFDATDSVLKSDELHGAEPFLWSRQVCSYSGISQHFIKPEGSLPCSQEPSTDSYPEPDQRICPSPRPFSNKRIFYSEELLAPKLGDHSLSVVRDYLFNIFAATFHIWRLFPLSATASLNNSQRYTYVHAYYIRHGQYQLRQSFALWNACYWIFNVKHSLSRNKYCTLPFQPRWTVDTV